jgi:hypothetical protein
MTFRDAVTANAIQIQEQIANAKATKKAKGVNISDDISSAKNAKDVMVAFDSALQQYVTFAHNAMSKVVDGEAKDAKNAEMLLRNASQKCNWNFDVDWNSLIAIAKDNLTKLK